MKYNLGLVLGLVSHIFLVLGALGLLFSKTLFAGYVLFSLGCVLGLLNLSRSSSFEVSERFHLLSIIAGLATLGLFIFSGVVEYLVIAVLVLFVIDFMLFVIDSGNSKPPVEKKEDYSEYNEKKILDELKTIKEEFDHVQILEEGDIEDLSVKKQAEQIKKEFKNAVVVEDPKEGRYFYKEDGKMFHVAGCMALQRTDKRDLHSSNSRTELLAKGYKACKVCNS